MTINRNHRCGVLSIDYSRVEEGFLHCECGRDWNLKFFPNKGPSEETGLSKGKWTWEANPPIVDKQKLAQLAAIAKKRAIASAQKNKMSYTRSKGPVLTHSTQVRKISNEHNRTTGRTGLEEEKEVRGGDSSGSGELSLFS